MAPTFSFGKIEITADSTQTFPQSKPEPDMPFRVALLGDFSNRARSKASEPRLNPSAVRPVLIDRDNFDEVLAQFNVRIDLPPGAETNNGTTLDIDNLEDFHPDRIFTQVEAFGLLDDLRKRLRNPATFAAAAAEMRALTNTETSPSAEQTPRESGSVPDPAQINPSQLLDQIIDASPGQMREAKPAEALEDWQGYLRRLAAPHVVPQTTPQQRELVAHLQAAMGEQMRMILHDPGFQAVEAAWRSVYFLVQRLETNSQLQLYLLDVSKTALATDLHASEDLSSSAMYRLLVKQPGDSPNSQPWAVLAGNYTFNDSLKDVELLGRIAQIAAQAGAPFLAAASPQIWGCASLAATPDPDDWLASTDRSEQETWNALRQLPEASNLGLALPRYLLRPPYGRESEPIESFPFEEADKSAEHEKYLWGNPAFACVYLLAEAFSQQGWNLDPGSVREIHGLPMHVYEKDGAPVLKPCAEVLLTERAAKRILEQGPMPLLSLQGSDAVRLARFQSIASPLKALVGNWNRQTAVPDTHG